MGANERVLLQGETDGEVAAAAAASFYLTNPHPYPIELKDAYIVPGAALTANDTNYAEITVKKGSTDVVTQRDTTTSDTGDWVAGTSIPLTIAQAGASLVLEQGESFVVAKAAAASGVSSTFGVVASCAPVRS